MMKLTKVRINKYKCFLQPQEVSIEKDITVLVGKNESGKTALLEAIAKSNYFEDNPNFVFDDTYDFPKNEWKRYQKSDDVVEVIRCTYSINEDLLKMIEADVGKGIFKTKEFSYGIKYADGNTFYGIEADEKKFIKNLVSEIDIPSDIKTELNKITTLKQLIEFADKKQETFHPILPKLNAIKANAFEWDNLLEGYIAKKYLKPNIPRYWYFDEYYQLPSRINLNHLKSGQVTNELSKEGLQTSKALFEMANIDIDELLRADNFESFISELEATSNMITDEIFEYWKTNQNLEIKFEIETKPSPPHQPEKILNIRIRNTKHRVSLPLKNRSRGFIWFFSFIVWFSKIQSDEDANFILLLDEPGLNLHASAQDDLLRFIEERLGKKYQLIYTTHSPFMIDSTYLERVRTVYDSPDAKTGSIISEVIQEKDPDTLFPLQAALGYDIAQNLFISKNNLLVEGVSDLIYLTTMSNYLQTQKRVGLKNNTTIVPVGGLDKVASFISLMRGNKLNMVCLLDSFRNQKGKQRLDDLVKAKIIKDKNIRFYHEFVNTPNKKADIEDMFEKEEYLKIFNAAYPEYDNITLSDLDSNIPNILQQINQIIGSDRFNHYRPAYKLMQMSEVESFFSEATLDRFESVFEEINKYF